MNPFAAFGAIGAGFGLMETISGASAASQAAQQEANISKDIAGLQIQENQVRQQVMEVSAQRSQIENARQTQLAAAKGLAAAVNQGGGTVAATSGLAGGQAEARSAGAFQAEGIEQNLLAGRQMFGLDTQIDYKKMAMAQAQSDLATAQGQMAIGGAITNVGMNFMNMFGK